MSEETEGQDTGVDAVAGVAAGADPAAIALAVNAANTDPSIAEDTRVFLRKQAALIDDQRHYVRERYKQLVEQVEETWLRIWVLRLAVLLRIATAFVGVFVAAGLAFMVWDASRANGLIVESFSVPPDMASRGLSGQVVASQVLDKLAAMQNATGSSRPSQSYANSWGDNLKVEIPETGVSFGEFRRFLRGWLGHETHVTGEVYRTATGIAITARSGADVGGTYTEPETDLGALVQKAAEHVYASTQPFRYAAYLQAAARSGSQKGGSSRVDEARAIFTGMTSGPDPLERAWAWFGLNGMARNVDGNARAAAFYARKAIAINPDLPSAYNNLGLDEFDLGNNEAELSAYRTADALLSRSNPSNIDVRYANPYRLGGRLEIAMRLGDYTNAVSVARSGAEETNNSIRAVGPDDFRVRLALSLARQHDGIGAFAYWRDMPPHSDLTHDVARAINRLEIDAALENWPAVVASEASVEQTFAEYNGGQDFNAIIGSQVRPFLALAKAKLGDTAGAEALIGTTASDCYDCIRMRGNIAAIERNWGRADYWFARAVHDGPSIPMAYADWGQSLLSRGQPDAAIAKFKLANQKGPHFADPLEGWGEALMAKSQSHLALAKFADADRYAPNWGRLHLKWGEALGYAGKKDEARAQYQKASTLDLTAADRAELARVNAHG